MFKLFSKWFGKSSASRKQYRRRMKNMRRMTLENLENRELMANQILAVYDGAALVIKGTESDDTIKLHQINRSISIDNVKISTKSGGTIALIDASTIKNIQIFGFGGDDFVQVGNSASPQEEAITLPALIFGGNGKDKLIGGAGSDSISGQEGIDTLFGMAGNDKLLGGNLDDLLFGGAGDDTLFGEAGNDRLHGGVGNDIVTDIQGDNTVQDLAPPTFSPLLSQKIKSGSKIVVPLSASDPEGESIAFSAKVLSITPGGATSLQVSIEADRLTIFSSAGAAGSAVIEVTAKHSTAAKTIRQLNLSIEAPSPQTKPDSLFDSKVGEPIRKFLLERIGEISAKLDRLELLGQSLPDSMIPKLNLAKMPAARIREYLASKGIIVTQRIDATTGDTLYAVSYAPKLTPSTVPTNGKLGPESISVTVNGNLKFTPSLTISMLIGVDQSNDVYLLEGRESKLLLSAKISGNIVINA